MKPEEPTAIPRWMRKTPGQRAAAMREYRKGTVAADPAVARLRAQLEALQIAAREFIDALGNEYPGPAERTLRKLLPRKPR